MNASFRQALKCAYDKDNSLCTSVERYDAAILPRSECELPHSLARTCLLLGNSIEGLQTACALENSESIETMSIWIVRALCSEHGLHEYAAAWAVNCWLYVFQSNTYFEFSDYVENIRDYTSEKLAFLANHGDAFAAYQIYQNGRNVDGRTPDEWLEIAADADLAIARCKLAEQLFGDGTNDETKAIAINLWEDATAMGCREASNYLACHTIVEPSINSELEAESNTDQQQYDETVLLARSGDIDAQLRLGEIYEKGLMGCEPDQYQSFIWYLEAAKANSPEGQYNVAQCYRNGHGVDKEPETAFQYMKRSAEQGYIEAIEQLAGMYFAGEGINVSEPAAAEWFTKAANAGSGWACSFLSSMYDSGLGVVQDSDLAEQYRQKATALGYVETDDENEDDSSMSSPEEHGGFDAEDPLADKLLRSMCVTWDAISNEIDKRNLDMYKIQGREYMFIMMRLAMAYCSSKIEDLAQHLVLFMFGSACESFMDDMTQDQFSIDYEHFVQVFDQVHESQQKNLDDTLLASLYSINRNEGEYDPVTAKELAVEFVKLIRDNYIPVILEIVEGNTDTSNQPHNVDNNHYVENISDENLQLLLKLVEASWSDMCDVMRNRGYAGNADLAQGYMFLLLWISETLPVYSVEETTKAIIAMLISDDWKFVMNGMSYEDFAYAYVDARERMNQARNIPLSEAVERELIHVNSRYYDKSKFTNDGSLEEQRDVVLKVFIKNLSTLSVRSITTKR